ncbi:MAG: transposase [Candidatus Methanomethyliales bacterium]|nr:transposase [Candidatus Methanomethylicales archaeon]
MNEKENIIRGVLVIEAEFIRKYHQSLKLNNKGKKGRPFKLSERYIQLLALIRQLYGLPYRELEIFAKRLSEITGLPYGDYSGLRRRIIKSELDPLIQSSKELIKSDKELSIILTASDLKLLSITHINK